VLAASDQEQASTSSEQLNAFDARSEIGRPAVKEERTHPFADFGGSGSVGSEDAPV